MFVVQAPWPALQTSLVLPSPKLGNNKSLAATVQTIRAMDGTTYTFIKSKRGRKAYTWDFEVFKPKANEAKSMIERYAGKLVQVTDDKGTIRRGWITINPLDLVGQSADFYRFTLTFEEAV